MKKIVYIFLAALCFCFLNCGIAAGQSIDSSECFIDADPGVGNGIPVSISSADSILDSVSVNSTGVAPGFHIIYFRVKDSSGAWSLYEGGRFYIADTIPPPAAASFDSIGGESFFDADPGAGNGIPANVSPVDSIYDTLMISTTGLLPGFHNCFFRARDTNGVWSLYDGGQFYVYDTTIPPVVSSYPISDAEYFYDTDPGIGNGFALTAFTAADSISLSDTLPTAPLTAGMHYLFVRVSDSLNRWSLYEGVSFVLCNFVPVPDFTSDTVCQNSPATFTDLTTNLDTTANYTYSWDFNGDGIIDDTTRGNTQYTFLTGGTHSVSLVVNNTSGCIDTVVKIVYVDSLPMVSLVLPLDTMCKLDTLVLAGGNPPGGTYSGPGVYSGIFYSDSTTTGNKTITYTYTNSDSCTASAADVIYLNPCTGIHELQSENFKFRIRPNPFSNSALLEITSAYGNQKIKMELFDVFGKILRQSEITVVKSEIARENLPAGIYFLKLSYRNEILGTAKLIVFD